MTRQHAYHGAGILLDRAGDWRDAAACRHHDPEMWFPHESAPAKPAKDICNDQCPVRVECLQFALDQRIGHGIWGGLGTTERDKLRKAKK